MSRIHAATSLIIATLAPAILGAACTSGAGGNSVTDSGFSGRAGSETGTWSGTGGCAVPSGAMSARDGVISAGPFDDNLRWLQEDGSKLWVATSVDQDATGADTSAERINSTTPPLLVHRGPDMLAIPDGRPPGLFFPGSFHLPGTGTWKISVTIGPDTGCFLVKV